MAEDLPHALIGHTGFVGGNLLSQRPNAFGACFNSSNIGAMAGRQFGRVVCAGVQAAKWWANANPVEDRARIESLLAVLRTIKARHMVLVSTVDVYPEPIACDETSPIDSGALQPYGRHRLEVEMFCRAHFERCSIVRLPALFGPGLKKNVVFDLLNDNLVDRIHPDAMFQWYPLTRLADDLDRIIAAECDLINLTTEPVATSEIAARYFPERMLNRPLVPAPRYDLRSCRMDVFGRSGPYRLDRSEVLADLGDWLAAARRGA